MNIHHLELFYYVAKHGGISHAVRNMPYGIQQPAVSAQILQLESSLGVPLFVRRPFALTPPGEDLYAFIRPFFDNLYPTGERLRGASQQIRIAASEIVLADYLPIVLREVRRKFPQLKLALRVAYHPEIEQAIQSRDLDLGITICNNKASPGIRSLPLLELPFCLLVPKKSRWKTAEEILHDQRPSATLISLPANEPITRQFQDSLRTLSIDWLPEIEVNSISLVNTYVREGYGIGLSVMIPAPPPVGLRQLPLNNLSPIRIGALYAGKATPLISTFLEEMKRAAAKLRS